MLQVGYGYKLFSCNAKDQRWKVVVDKCIMQIMFVYRSNCVWWSKDPATNSKNCSLHLPITEFMLQVGYG